MEPALTSTGLRNHSGLIIPTAKKFNANSLEFTPLKTDKRKLQRSAKPAGYLVGAEMCQTPFSMLGVLRMAATVQRHISNHKTPANNAMQWIWLRFARQTTDGERSAAGEHYAKSCDEQNNFRRISCE